MFHSRRPSSPIHTCAHPSYKMVKKHLHSLARCNVMPKPVTQSDLRLRLENLNQSKVTVGPHPSSPSINSFTHEYLCHVKSNAQDDEVDKSAAGNLKSQIKKMDISPLIASVKERLYLSNTPCPCDHRSRAAMENQFADNWKPDHQNQTFLGECALPHSSIPPTSYKACCDEAMTAK